MSEAIHIRLLSPIGHGRVYSWAWLQRQQKAQAWAKWKASGWKDAEAREQWLELHGQEIDRRIRP